MLQGKEIEIGVDLGLKIIDENVASIETLIFYTEEIEWYSWLTKDKKGSSCFTLCALLLLGSYLKIT